MIFKKSRRCHYNLSLILPLGESLQDNFCKKKCEKKCHELMTTIPRKMLNNPDTKELTFYGLGNQLESTTGYVP
jgi:hypothetical protein